MTATEILKARARALARPAAEFTGCRQISPSGGVPPGVGTLRHRARVRARSASLNAS